MQTIEKERLAQRTFEKHLLALERGVEGRKNENKYMQLHGSYSTHFKSLLYKYRNVMNIEKFPLIPSKSGRWFALGFGLAMKLYSNLGKIK